MTNKEIYNITFSINRPYLLFAMVTLYSLLKNNRNYYFNVYILHNNCLKDWDINDAISQEPLNHFDNFKVHLVDVSHLKELNELKTVRHWTKEIYFKVFLPELLPSVDKILHLDTDVIVQGDIKRILDTDIKDYIFAAASESKEEQFYNVGVMLFNLNKMREENIMTIIFNVMLKQHIHEQEAINITCGNNIKAISNDDIFITKEHFTFNRDKNLIIHYIGAKPWQIFKLKHIKHLKRRGDSVFYDYYQDFVDSKYKNNFKIYMFFIKIGILVVYYSILRRLITSYQKRTKQIINRPQPIMDKLYKYSNIKKS